MKNAGKFVHRLVENLDIRPVQWNCLIDRYPLEIDFNPDAKGMDMAEQRLLGVYYRELQDVFILLFLEHPDSSLEDLDNPVPYFHINYDWKTFLECSQELVFQMEEHLPKENMEQLLALAVDLIH